MNNLIETILFDASGFSEERMSKDKNKLIEAKQSGRVSLTAEEERELFS